MLYTTLCVKLALVSNLFLSFGKLMNTAHSRVSANISFPKSQLYQLQFALECSMAGHVVIELWLVNICVFVCEVEVRVHAMFKDQKEPIFQVNLLFSATFTLLKRQPPAHPAYTPVLTTNVLCLCWLAPFPSLSDGGLFLLTLASPWFKL